MSNEVRKGAFRWTVARVQAAIDLAEDSLTDDAIAARAGVSGKQLRVWKKAPEFAARIADHVARLEAEALKYTIAHKRERMRRLNDRWMRIQRLIEARALALADIPGGETGLLVRQVKQIGQGLNAQIVEEYAADTPLLREEREQAKQAAQEMGQWSEKRELTGPGGGALIVRASFDWHEYQRLYVEAAGLEPAALDADGARQSLDSPDTDD